MTSAMHKPVLKFVAMFATAACLITCEPVPHNAIADARTALEQASAAGGRTWAPTQLSRGQVFFDSAMKELSVEKKKLPFMRNYTKVTELLNLASEAGYFVSNAVQAAYAQIRAESRQRLDLAKVLADSLNSALAAAAASGKIVGHLQAALDSASIVREEALAALNSGDLLLAEEKSMAASDKTAKVALDAAKVLSPHKKNSKK